MKITRVSGFIITAGLAGVGNLALVAKALAPVAPAPAAQVAAPIPPASSPAAAFPELVKDPNGFLRVSFEHLASFSFVPPPEGTPMKPGSVEMIPANVRALDGQRVCVGGYMLALKMENGLVREFLLIRNPMTCCYGTPPAMNEWVVVRMKSEPILTTMDDVPLTLYGTLHVGAVYDDKAFSGLYELDGEKVTVN